MDRTAFAPFRSLRRACSLAALLLCGLAVAPLHAQTDDDTTQRALALENTSRARPIEAAQALEALLPGTSSASPQRIELLTIQGLGLAVGTTPDAIERSAARLEDIARTASGPTARLAAASALLVRARSLARAGNLPRADRMLDEATAQLPADLPARDRFRFVFAHGYVKDHLGQFEAAVRFNHAALALADALPEAWRQSEARSSLAYSYYNARQLERAHVLGTEAIGIAQRHDDDVSLSHAYNVTGIVLDSLGDQPGERRMFEGAIAAAHRAGAKGDETRFLANLADFYLKNGEYKTALARAEAALPLARDLKDATSEMVALANIGLAHIGLQHLELGKRYVHESMAIDEGRGSVSGVADLYEDLGRYLEKAGDFSGAAQAYHQYRRLAISLLPAGDQEAILAMQEQYDADRRKQALTLLNREGEIKAEQLRRGDLRQRLYWLLAAAFVLSFAVVALLYRRVRQTNALLSSSNEQLKVQSELDPLTGLANRRHFQSVMRQVAEDGKLSGTVFLIDIDHFKHINDRHGHGTGDTVLVEVARRLRETLREQDLIVRWGGEEFLVVVRSLAADQVDALAQRMLGVLDRTPVVCGAQRISVTASIGFATFPIGPAPLRVSWERAINLVDTAMYLAKAHGRNRAYGVRLLHARDEASLEAITHSLENAWREGQVELTLLQGRVPLTVAVAA